MAKMLSDSGRFSRFLNIQLAFSAASIFFIISTALLLSEVFSGPLRYYLSIFGVAWLVYLPKVACLIFFVISLFYKRFDRTMWVMFFFIPASAVIAVLNNASTINIVASLFFFSPFFFALAASKYINDDRWKYSVLFILLFALCAAGLILDAIIEFPWKGYIYALDKLEITANKQWTQFGVDRLAGFSRNSASLGIMLGVFSLFLYQPKRIVINFGIFVFSLVLIIFTTYKSAIPAYIVAVAMLYSHRMLVKKAGFILVSIGIFLPLLSVIYEFSYIQGYTQSYFNSFHDRLANTWPSYLSQVDNAWTLFFGFGFGAVGTSTIYFPVPGIATSVADNTALYLFGMFGLFGLWLYAKQAVLINTLIRSGLLSNKKPISVMFFLITISLMTDITESVVALYFLGLIVSIGRDNGKETYLIHDLNSKL